MPDESQLIRELAVPGTTKLVLLVLDGLGGLPSPDTGLTELETAHTPNLDRLAEQASLGLSTPVRPGVAPGSGPGHLALFGFNPERVRVGRGVLSALGVGIDLRPADVACRVNFATREGGVITDRRAGRIPTEVGRRLCEKLRQIRLPGVELIIEPEMQYRAVVVLRGEGLSPAVSDTDPQQEGVPPLPPRPLQPGAERTAALVVQFLEAADRLLADEHPANTLLLRGFDSLPPLPSLSEAYHLKPAVLAVYPMYRGLARLVGMEVLDAGHDLTGQLAALRAHWDEYDFFFVHVKPADSAGEDGDFAGKVRVIEAVDRAIPDLLALEPDVLVITGDHSTPALFRAHSWHPVPVLLYSRYSRREGPGATFGERACARGQLGSLRAMDLLPLMLAHGRRLKKFGA